MIAQSIDAMVKSRPEATTLRSRQKLGKYRIEKRLAQGGFAHVYQAFDTIEGVHVALKMPHQANVTPHMLDTFHREARLVADRTCGRQSQRRTRRLGGDSRA